MNIGIVGGGLMGVSLGYFLSQQGATVEVFEAASALGGLASQAPLEDGTAVDRFYHTILSSDGHLRQLCAELGIEDELRFRETRMGFYYRGETHSMNNVVEFLRFPPLGWVDRFRLGLTVLYAQFVRDWQSLEGISVEQWLLRWSGRRTYENIWKPLLKAKFDGSFDDTPATYIWSRLVRMKSTRSGASQKEEAGYLIGGYVSMVEAMAERIADAGGRIHLNAPVQEIVVEQGHTHGVRVAGQVRALDAVVSTLQLPAFLQMIPAASDDYRQSLGQTEYLGIVCPVVALDRPLTGFWTLNITDDGIPFTGIIETTTYIDPQDVGGHHLVYLPKYTVPGSRWQGMPDAEIREVWLEKLGAMFPQFDRRWVRQFLVHRESYVEPMHPLNSTHLVPAVKTPIENLYLVTTAQIYPQLTNGESVSQHARQSAELLSEGVLQRAEGGMTHEKAASHVVAA
jgi:protoporphyrinogen oxidase